MQFTNYWQQFEHTGRVEDYLNYLRSTEGTDFPNACCSNTSVDCRAEGCKTLTPGRKDHAGIPVCNGNCIKTVAVW